MSSSKETGTFKQPQLDDVVETRPDQLLDKSASTAGESPTSENLSQTPDAILKPDGNTSASTQLADGSGRITVPDNPAQSNSANATLHEDRVEERNDTVDCSDAVERGSNKYLEKLEIRIEALEKERDRILGQRYTPDNQNLAPYYEDEDEMQDFTEPKVRWIHSSKWREVKNTLKIIVGEPALLVSYTTPGDAERIEISNMNMTKTRLKFEEATGDVNIVDVTAVDKQPNRIAINSRLLAHKIESVTGASLEHNVMVRPFKLLVVYQDRLRRALEELENDVAKNDSFITQNECEEPGMQASSADPKADAEKNITGSALERRSSESNELDVRELRRLRAQHDQLRCLIDFMDDHLKPIFDLRRSISNESLQQISYSDLWHLFQPGALVISNSPELSGICRAFRVLHVTGGRPILNPNEIIGPYEISDADARITLGSKITPFILDCFYLDYDGSRFGPRSKRITFEEYRGYKDILALEVVPLPFLHDAPPVQQTLIARGHKYTSLVPTAHVLYERLNIEDQFQRSYREQVNSEVVLDQEAGIDHFQRFTYSEKHFGFGDETIKVPTRMNIREVTERLKFSSTYSNHQFHEEPVSDIFNDANVDIEERNNFLNSTHLLTSVKAADLTEEHLVLLTPRVYGYALQDRKWHALSIEGVKKLEPTIVETKTNHTAFDDLVLPKKHKDLLQALVKNQTRRFQPHPDLKAANFEDVSIDLVRGKGKGLIILLHGVPGVGKTSTAECVASQLQRPLFPITCGDLGVEAATVESKLEEYFRLAQRWGCVLLLDEADVFLAKRSPDQLVRNGLVSVFLRVLEYYAGVLILTTNRVGEFDEAFRSRIHVSLYYPKLEKQPTAEIWEMNLRRVKYATDMPLDVDEDGIREFYEAHWRDNEEFKSRRWNGRQIKNAFQTAIALANWEFYDENKKAKLQRPRLRKRHFVHVAKTSNHFDDYLASIQMGEGLDQKDNVYSYMAKRENLRNDDSLSGVGSEKSSKGRHMSPPQRRRPMNTKDTPETKEMKMKRLELELTKLQIETEKRADEVEGESTESDSEDEGGTFG